MALLKKRKLKLFSLFVVKMRKQNHHQMMNKLENYCLQMYEDMNLLKKPLKPKSINLRKKNSMSLIIKIIHFSA